MDGTVPDAGMEALVNSIGKRAQEAGYIGLAGCDIGETSDGRLVVFDPNFRINASTAQVLLHRSAAQRMRASVSMAVSLRTSRPFPEMLTRIRDLVASGLFVPLRGMDAGYLSAANGISSLIGFVLGDSAATASATAALLQQRLGTG